MSRDIPTNTQHGIVSDFDKTFAGESDFHQTEGEFKSVVFSINKEDPSEGFARRFNAQAEAFLQAIQSYRETQIEQEGLPHLQELTQAQDS